MRQFSVKNKQWVLFQRAFDNIQSKDFLHCVQENIFYNIVGTDLIAMEKNFNFKYWETPRTFSGNLNDDFVRTIIQKNDGYIFKSDGWEYFIEMKLSSAFTQGYQKYNAKATHKLEGYNLRHFLKINGETIEIPYFKTSLIPRDLLQYFIDNYCVMPQMLGFKNIGRSMYKKIKALRNKSTIMNKNDLVIAITLDKLLK